MVRPKHETILALTNGKISPAHWVLDGGAAKHTTGQRRFFISMSNAPPGWRVLGVGGAVEVQGVGVVELPIQIEDKNGGVVYKKFRIEPCLYAPGLPFNIVAQRALTLNGNNETGVDIHCAGWTCEIIRRSTSAIIAEANCRTTDLYTLQLQEVGLSEALASNAYPVVTTISSDVPLMTWHRRLGHLKEGRLKRLLRSQGVDLRDETLPNCEACDRGTLRRRNYSDCATRATAPFGRICMDIKGPVNVYIDGSKEQRVDPRFALLVVDDFSRYRWIWFIRSKTEVGAKLKAFVAWVKNQFGVNVQRFRSDNGSEFSNKSMESIREHSGIEFEPTVPYNPEQNGIAERSIETMMNSTRSILRDANLPDHCFAEVMTAAIFLINLSPTSANNDISPYERFWGKQPKIDFLRVIGCECWKPVPRNNQLKTLDDRAEKCYLLGYEQGNHMYRVWNADTKKIQSARDLHFNEDVFGSPPTVPVTVNRPAEDDELLVRERLNDRFQPKRKRTSSLEGERALVAIDPVRSKLSNIVYPIFVGRDGCFNEEFREINAHMKQMERVPIALSQVDNDDFNCLSQAVSILCSVDKYCDRDWLTLLDQSTYAISEPKTYNQAITGTEADKWKASMEDECNSIIKNSTWNLVDRKSISPETTVLSGKYVYKIKTDADGKPVRYKSRWVVRGFEQEYGVDYNETFASVVKPVSYKMLFVLACVFGWYIDQMDVKTAFLYGDIDTDVFVELPPNLKDNHPGMVCKLNKALYGLKQAPRIWFNTLKSALQNLGFAQIIDDYSVFVNKDEGVILAVYVDDLLVMGSSRINIDRTKKELGNRFEMTDLGDASHYLGIRITREEKYFHGTQRWARINLSQGAYTKKLLRDFGMSKGERTATPMDPSQKLRPYEKQATIEERRRYQSLIGSLMYLMLCTRPDISFAVSQLSRYCSNPGPDHQKAARRVLKYLAGTVDMGLVIESDGSGCGDLLGYVDASWGDNDDRRSTGGYVFLLNNTAISWRSHRQETVAVSTCEAEYVEESEATKEAIFLRRLLANFGYTGPFAVQILGDNKSALALASNPMFHKRTKHVDIRYHFVREKIQEGKVVLGWVDGKLNLADGFTKPLSKESFDKFVYGMGLRRITQEAEHLEPG